MSRLFKKISKKNKGFTLIEMIVVVAIIAILVSIAVPQALNQINKAKVSADLANARNIAMAFQQHLADGGNLNQQTNWTAVKDDATVSGIVQKYLSGGIPQVKYNKDWNYEYRYENDTVYVGVYSGTSIGNDNNYQLYPQVTQKAQNANGSSGSSDNPYYGK